MSFYELLDCDSVREFYFIEYSNLSRNAYNKLKILFPKKAKGILVNAYNTKTRRRALDEKREIFEISEVSVGMETLILLPVDENDPNKLVERLKMNGVSQVAIYDEKADLEINAYLPETPKLELRQLSLTVGQACNLKCRDCSNMVPYACSENKRYSIEKVIRDVDAVLPCFKEIDTLHIQGGETFLHTELDKLILYLRNKYGSIFERMHVATNGTIVPSDRVLFALRDSECSVRISDYPIQNGNSQIYEKLNQLGISYRRYEFSAKDGEWYDKGGPDCTLEERDWQNHINSCEYRDCFMTENGLIGRCARSIPALTIQKVPFKKEQYLVLDENLSTERIKKFFMFTQPMECCKHCFGSAGKRIPPAIQLDD